MAARPKFLGWLMLACCTRPESPHPTTTPPIQVTNPAPTAWADTNGWRIVLERTVTFAASGPGSIGEPEEVIAGNDGTIYMLQSKPATVKVFGPDGQWLRDIGREGDGPGEFRGGGIALVGDTLVVHDMSNIRITTFRTTGEMLATVKSVCCAGSTFLPVFADGRVGIYGATPTSEPDRDIALYLTQLNGTVTDTILGAARPRGTSQPGAWSVSVKGKNGASSRSMPIPLTPFERGHYLPTGGRVTGNTGSYTFAITGMHGDTVRTFSATTATARPIPTATRDSLYEAALADVPEEMRDAMRQVADRNAIPSHGPVWSWITVDGDSRIWISHKTPDGKMNLLDVFTPEGILLGTVPAPNAWIALGYWTKDHIFVLGESAEGEPHIKVYKIVK